MFGMLVCLLVAVAVESWSWIASVFTRPLNKAFLSVFLVFVILVWLSFFFVSLCIPSTSSAKIFGLNVSSSLLFFFQTRSFLKVI